MIKKTILNHLRIKNNKLYLDDSDLLSIVEEYGSPLFIFSESRVRENVREILQAFKKYYHDSYVYYAVKANSLLAILKIIKEEGLGCEISSSGELFKALKAGYDTDKIIFNGPGKSFNELEIAAKLNIHCVNVDSFYELKLLSYIAERLNVQVNVSLRIVPEIITPILKTGTSSTKFGFEKNEIVKAYRLALSLKGINVKGIHAHFGSQISDINAWVCGSKALVNIANTIYDELGIEFEHINIGGGLPVDYTQNFIPVKDEVPDYFKPNFDAESVAKMVAESLKELKYKTKLYIEPGRRIVADAGILLTKVVNFKERSFNEKWLIVDAGFNVLPSARILHWYYPILNVSKINESHDTPFRIGGPLCDAHDVYHDLDGEEKNMPKLPKYRLLPASSTPGDVLAILHVGAYGPDLMMNFNGMLRPTVIIVTQDKGIRIIRRGEKLEDFSAYDEI